MLYRAYILRLSVFLASLLVVGCGVRSERLVKLHYKGVSKPSHFRVCHGYGCKIKAPIGLDSAQWYEITQPLASASESAEQEREQIALVVAAFEQAVGQLVNTQDDLPKSSATQNKPGQLDCVDETVNTYTYLMLLQQEGLLRWHRVATPAYRGFVVDWRMPHNSATIEEMATGQVYVLDSWPGRNGDKPLVMALDDWYQQ